VRLSWSGVSGLMRASHISVPQPGHCGRTISLFFGGLISHGRMVAPATNRYHRDGASNYRQLSSEVVDWNQKEAAAGEAASLLIGRHEGTRRNGGAKT
jgi:hypothetical protein